MSLNAMLDIEAAVERLLADGSIIEAELRLRATTSAEDLGRYAVAQANASINGQRFRAQVAAPTAADLPDAIADRLRAQIIALDSNWAPRTGPQDERQWPARQVRQATERQLVRRKFVDLEALAPAEAMQRMDRGDYNFYLHRGLENAETCLLYRVGPTGYRIATPSHHARPTGLVAPLTWDRQAPLHFDVGEALEHLNRTDFPFLFYIDGASATVMYRRYDGNYGLICESAH
jgi:hypothetical protein